MTFTECADCKEAKTGLQQKRQRCRSCSGKGRPYSSETKEKLRVAGLGQTRSLQSRQKQSISSGGDGDLENRRYPGIKRWTRLVKERDGHKCAECDFQGIKGDGIMEAHHVIPKALHPELATEVFNGVTLCKPCHKDIHR
jgi:5-methylcytosine-specific restriction endonuclease McrA